MEAEPGQSAEGKRSGRQEQQPVAAEPSPGSSQSQQTRQLPNPRPIHRALGRLQNRPPKRTDLLLRLQQHQAVAWQHSDTSGPSGGSFFSPASASPSLPSTSSTQGEQSQAGPSQLSQDSKDRVSSPRREKKPQKPGKYVCTYCGRPCAKPSVLQKHIRSHTGERPYPCAPCGFSFKTKSNLYKHRKSHAHRIKAGLASSHEEPSLSGPEGGGVGDEPEEHTEGESTESEEETGQHKKSSSKSMGYPLKKGPKEHLGEESQRPEDSQAVKQRLALRLSERKRGPVGSPDDAPSSLSTSSSSSVGPGSKGSTESGYFSGSGSTSTDLSQVSPPSASAKTYAEIILGKYGRLGGQQRNPHPHQTQSPLCTLSGTDEKSVPFAVPKTQVIEHITKLITINEAVVDTSEIDSVKPRRSSISRKSSTESAKLTSQKDPYAFDPKADAPGPSGMRLLRTPQTDSPGKQGLSTVPLLRSHSMPSSTSQHESHRAGAMSHRGFRLCQSFDEQQAVVAEMRVGHAHRMLRRQPAIEVPLGSEQILEETSPTYSSLTRSPEPARIPLQQQQKSFFECETCRARFQHSDGYRTHRGVCTGMQQLEQESMDASRTSHEERPQMMMHHKFKALAMAVRKRRKEESLEEDPPSPVSAVTSGSPVGLIPMSGREDSPNVSGVSSQAQPRQQEQQDRKGVSVIQHTSSFEKQESVSMEAHEPDVREGQQIHSPEPKPSPSASRLIRQHNIQVPEILVTVEPDADMPSVSLQGTSTAPKEAEKVEEFQWPQRSQTLAQLPAEKLPPKKKRLRLAEAAQSSGESSFESVSLPRSPSQESNISHTSSISASFEDTSRPDPSAWASSSQSSQMLTVPSSSHQSNQSYREMRRSASEQAPSSHQQTEQIPETRSKSFDYGSLSSQQSASSWKERRKCLLVRHATLGEPDQDEGLGVGLLPRSESPKPGPSRSSHPPMYSDEAGGSDLSRLQVPSQDQFPLQLRGQQTFPSQSSARLLPVTTATISDILSSHFVHGQLLDSRPELAPAQVHPLRIGTSEPLGVSPHQFPDLGPFEFSTGTRGNLYFPVPPKHTKHILASVEGSTSVSPALTQSLVTISYVHPSPVIATCLAQFTPVVSLVVPVRLHTHLPAYASAMYTTLSQVIESAGAQPPSSGTAVAVIGCLEQDKMQRSYLKVPSPEITGLLPFSLSTELASGSGEGYGSLGAGGSKRMLSPAASLELSTEAQRQQKRVKEEEEREPAKADEESENVKEQAPEEEEKSDRLSEGDQTKQADILEFTTVKTEGEPALKAEKDIAGKSEESPMASSQKKNETLLIKKAVEKPTPEKYPSLNTSTSVNWCYLNYVKPNPTAERDPSNSVYSSWSVSAHNPNLPGLSTKVALSLLCSKQKHSPETYTMAAVPISVNMELTPARTSSHVPEVPAVQPSSLTEVTDLQRVKEENKEMTDDNEASTSKACDAPRVRIFEGGYKSNEEYIYVRGRGRGKYVCGECGIRCKKPSMLKKHIRTHTDVRPFICKHCNFAFKTKGNLTKHMKSKAHGKKCQATGMSESSLDEPESEETGSEEHVCGSEEQEEHQFSEVDESEEDEDNDDDDDDEEEESNDDPPSSCSSDTHPSVRRRSKSAAHSRHSTPDPDTPGPSPGSALEPAQRGAWRSRRAVFSRRGWKASPRAFSPSSDSCSPSHSLSPRLDLSSPIQSLSPRTELSSPSRHVSPSPERGPSPIRPLSPLRPISPSCYRSSKGWTPPSPLGPQHRAPGSLPWESHERTEKGGGAGKGQTSGFLPSALRLSTCDSFPVQRAADHVFSHLPMHSQQPKVPYLMIPIGGIQMVQARPRSQPSSPLSLTSPPLEGSSLSWFESYWTPRTDGLRTPGDHWTEQQTAGTSRSAWSGLTQTPTKLERTDVKQYGSSASSASTRRPAPDTSEGCSRDSRSEAALSRQAAVAPHRPARRLDVATARLRDDLEEGGANTDSARPNQST
ncbi:transcription factor HIVEP3 isoform 2-T3 [Synchiropus picturatus]